MMVDRQIQGLLLLRQTLATMAGEVIGLFSWWQTVSTDEVSLVTRDSGSISIGKLLWLERSLASSVDGTDVTGSRSAGRVSLVT